MKRTFLKVALLSSLISMPVAFTSCKDYDEDIKSLREKDVDLQSQIDALKTAAATAQSSADAAKAAADAAMTAAKTAQSAAEAAQKAAEAAAQAGTAAAAQAKADAIKESIAQVQEILKGYATQADLTAAVSRIAAIETGLNKTNTAVDELQKAQAQMQIQLDALKKYQEYGTQIGLMQKDIDAVKKEIESIQTALKNCVTAADLNKAIEKVSNDLSTKNANVITLLTKQLRSLVYIPTLYVDGIEATEYDYLKYHSMKTGAATAQSGTNEDGQQFTVLAAEKQTQPWNWTANTGWSYKNMPRTIEYELNPSTAEVKASDVTLISRNVEVITRAAADPKITFSETGFVANKNGNLVVGYTALGQNLNPTDGTVWVMAAQVNNYNDETSAVGNITSDYALVYGADVVPLAIAYNETPAAATAAYPNDYHAKSCSLSTNELWTTAILAGQNVPSVTVQWDGSVDLSKIIEIHYDKNTETSNAKKHARMSLKEAEDLYGLTVAYYPVQYTVGSNKTSDTKFTTLNGSVVTPCGVTDTGEPTQVANKNSVGRSPMYQVQILDGKNVVLVGFIKIKIVETKEAIVDVTTGNFNLGSVKFDCAGGGAAVTWAQINNILLGHVGENGISKEQFVADYQLQVSNGVAVQYSKPGTVAASSAILGQITEVPNQTSTTTTVLNWYLSMNDQQTVYENANHTATVYVCYEKKVNPAQSPKYYLPLVISVQKPQDLDNNINLSTKSQNYWMRNMTVAITNCKVPEDNGIPTYASDLDDEWFHLSNGSQVSGPQVNVNPAVTSAFGIKTSTFATQNTTGSGYKYYFTAKNNRTVNSVPVNGTTAKVVFSVDNNTAACIIGGRSHNVTAENQGNHALLATSGEFTNTKLYAQIGTNAKEVIAVLDQTSGVVTYQENATAKALLNAYASYNGVEPVLDRLSAELYANVGVCAYYGCDLVLPLVNGNWDAYFLRPVNIAAVSPENFQDAKDNGSTLNVFDMLTFTDWRNQSFAKNPWYYAFYQVTAVSIDTANILSNAATGSFAKNETINACFTYTAGSAITAATCQQYNMASASASAINTAWKAAFGTLTYKNDGTNTKDFKVQIPVKITYYWGDIYVTVEADVKATLH